MKKENITNLLLLPKVILLEIIFAVSLPDLLALVKTCKYLKEILDKGFEKIPDRLKQIYLQNFPYLQDIFTNNLSAVSEITIRSYGKKLLPSLKKYCEEKNNDTSIKIPLSYIIAQYTYLLELGNYLKAVLLLKRNNLHINTLLSLRDYNGNTILRMLNQDLPYIDFADPQYKSNCSLVIMNNMLYLSRRHLFDSFFKEFLKGKFFEYSWEGNYLNTLFKIISKTDVLTILTLLVLSYSCWQVQIVGYICNYLKEKNIDFLNESKYKKKIMEDCIEFGESRLFHFFWNRDKPFYFVKLLFNICEIQDPSMLRIIDKVDLHKALNLNFKKYGKTLPERIIQINNPFIILTALELEIPLEGISQYNKMIIISQLTIIGFDKINFFLKLWYQQQPGNFFAVLNSFLQLIGDYGEKLFGPKIPKVKDVISKYLSGINNNRPEEKVLNQEQKLSPVKTCLFGNKRKQMNSGPYTLNFEY